MLILHPQMAHVDCGFCQEYLVNLETGQPEKQATGQPIRRNLQRNPPACRVRGQGCVKGTPEKPLTLSRKNLRAYRHYLRCRALGNWPDDSLVRRNAGIIMEAETEAERYLAWHNRRLQHQTLVAATRPQIA